MIVSNSLIKDSSQQYSEKNDFVDISVIVPVFNDTEVIPELLKRLLPVLKEMKLLFEIIFVDDGSRDSSASVIRDYLNTVTEIILIILDKNYGQANAIAAGLTAARGNFQVVMDADLQDRPEDIPLLFEKIVSDNVDMVLAKREESITGLRKLLSITFLRLSNLITTINHPPRTGVFRIIRKNALKSIIGTPQKPGTFLSRLLQEKKTYCCISLNRESRFAGQSGYTVKKLISLALSRFLVYPVFPLKITGLTISLITFLLICLCSLLVNELLLASFLIAFLFFVFLIGIKLMSIDVTRQFATVYKIREIVSIKRSKHN